MKGKEWNDFDIGLVGFLYASRGGKSGIPLTIGGHAIVLQIPTYCRSQDNLSIQGDIVAFCFIQSVDASLLFRPYIHFLP